MATTGISMYPLNPDGPLCYDLGRFHGQCEHVFVTYPWVYCENCRVVAHIDLVGFRIATPPGSSVQRLKED